MGAAWKLQDVQNHFEEILEEALNSGPQTVTRSGEPVVVVVDIETWKRLSSSRPDFEAFLRSAPLDGLDLTRDAGERTDIVLP
jgi:antitoxin Phd